MGGGNESMVEKERNSVELPSRSRIRCARRDGWPLGSKNNTGSQGLPRELRKRAKFSFSLGKQARHAPFNSAVGTLTQP